MQYYSFILIFENSFLKIFHISSNACKSKKNINQFHIYSGISPAFFNYYFLL